MTAEKKEGEKKWGRGEKGAERKVREQHTPVTVIVQGQFVTVMVCDELVAV